MDIKEITKSYKDYVIKLRREFHENPEKSMRSEERRVGKELEHQRELKKNLIK